jgi:hypothetical protein
VFQWAPGDRLVYRSRGDLGPVLNGGQGEQYTGTVMTVRGTRGTSEYRVTIQWDHNANPINYGPSVQFLHEADGLGRIFNYLHEPRT